MSEHLANERTILAWIRTAIAVMTLGVAINRFSLFLMEVHQVVPRSTAANRHVERLGIGLVILGIVVMCGAIVHYLHVGRTIESETYRPANLFLVVTSFAIVLMGGSALFWRSARAAAARADRRAGASARRQARLPHTPPRAPPDRTRRRSGSCRTHRS